MTTFFGHTATEANAALDDIWPYLTGSAALPSGRATANLATYLANQSNFNVKDYGVGVGTGSATVDTAAFQACLAAATAWINSGFALGADVWVPSGSYRVTDTVAVTADRIRIRGPGKHVAAITFTPTSAKPLFKFYKTDNSVAYQSGLSGLGFFGGGTHQKIAIDCVDCSEFKVSDIAVHASWTGNSGSTSTPSIGIRTSGRELFIADDIDIFADRPIHIVRNPNAPALSADHYHFSNCYLGPQVSTEACYTIDGDAGIANLQIDGRQAWVGGKYGVWYKSGSAPATALSATIVNGRREGATDLTGYAIRWEAPTISLTLLGVNLGGVGGVATWGGLYARNVDKLTLINTLYTGGGGSVALDADNSVTDMVFVNAYWGDGSIATLGAALEPILADPRIISGAPLPQNAHYINTVAQSRYATLFGVKFSRRTGTLAVNASINLTEIAAGSLTTAQVRVSAYSATGPTKAMGTWHVHGSGADRISGSANTADTDAGSSLNVVWSNPTTIALINRLAQPVTYLIVFEFV